MDHASNGQATTAYAKLWQPVLSKDYKLTITNESADVGVIVTVGDFHSDYLSPKANKGYDSTSNPSASAIEGGKGLGVSWSSYPGGPKGVCPNLDFDKDVNITIDTNDPSGKKGCGSYSMSAPKKQSVELKRRSRRHAR